VSTAGLSTCRRLLAARPFGKYRAFAHHLPDNPHIRFFESRLRGYTRCIVLRRRWYTDLRVVDTIERRDARVRTLARFVVEDGRPGADRVG
jgi:alkaline phosphatase D